MSPLGDFHYHKSFDVTSRRDVTWRDVTLRPDMTSRLDVTSCDDVRWRHKTWRHLTSHDVTCCQRANQLPTGLSSLLLLIHTVSHSVNSFAWLIWIFLSGNEMKITSFDDWFENLNLALRVASVSSFFSFFQGCPWGPVRKMTMDFEITAVQTKL